MQQIASDSRCVFFLHALHPDDALSPPFDSEPYAALVWATRPTFDAQKQRIAHGLIGSGCAYVVCGGAEAEAWEEAVDDACLAQDVAEPGGKGRFVTTTSHRGEPPDEVAAFLVHAAGTSGDLSRCLVLIVGPDGLVQDRLIEAIREETAASPE
jgi:hypothetical protein